MYTAFLSCVCHQQLNKSKAFIWLEPEVFNLLLDLLVTCSYRNKYTYSVSQMHVSLSMRHNNTILVDSNRQAIVI